MRARALLMTNRFCIPMGARYARPSVSPWMNADSKSADIPYRPSKAPSIARCTMLPMIAYGDACGFGDGMRGRSRNAVSPPIPIVTNLQCIGVMFNLF